MREVVMPTAIAAHPCRRPIVVFAAWLLVLQAFLTGVATARAGVAWAAHLADPICHGTRGADQASGGAPDDAEAFHACCAYCLSVVPTLAPPAAPLVVAPPAIAGTRAMSPFTVVITRCAIRAGPSQAPPAFA
jgi:hypothetical protein